MKKKSTLNKKNILYYMGIPFSGTLRKINTDYREEVEQEVIEIKKYELGKLDGFFVIKNYYWQSFNFRNTLLFFYPLAYETLFYSSYSSYINVSKRECYY